MHRILSQVQLPSGDLIVQTFGVNEPLSAVRLFLQMNQLKESPGDVVLSIVNPKKVFEEEEDYDCSLKDLGLTSYVLLKAEVVDFRVQISRVEPKRVLDEGFLSMQFRLAESQFARMATHVGGQKQKIISVDVVQNARLRASFKAKQKELEGKGKGGSLLLFHGTQQANIESILKNNFDLSIVTNGRRYGNGVYFSERLIKIQYFLRIK